MIVCTFFLILYLIWNITSSSNKEFLKIQIECNFLVSDIFIYTSLNISFSFYYLKSKGMEIDAIMHKELSLSAVLAGTNLYNIELHNYDNIGLVYRRSFQTPFNAKS